MAVGSKHQETIFKIQIPTIYVLLGDFQADDYSMNWLNYWISDQGVRQRLLLELAVRYKDRNGGYTRTIRSRIR